MIYFVTNNDYTGVHQRMGVEDSLGILSSMDVIGCDTETTGLDPHKDTILSLQLGNKDTQFVIDCTSVNINDYRPILENKDKLLLLWNAKFDLQFFFQHKIVPYKVWDGYVVEQLMHLGLNHDEYSASLQTACKTYLGMDMDKTIRGQIQWRGMDDDVITYGAGDVEHLERIMELQKAKLRQLGLSKAVEYENKFVIPLAYMEFCGIHMDKERWLKKMEQDEKRKQDALLKCNMWIVDHFNEGFTMHLNDAKRSKIPLVWVNREGDLWNGYDLTPKVGLNWDSVTHMTALFNYFGVDTSQGIEADLLKKQQDKCDLIPLYIAYKEATKVTSTYGQNFIDKIHPSTGRIHTKFNQFGTKTGRISSGGKDGKKQNLNLLNLPRDAETRACFTSEEGKRFISIDYSGQESFIMADITEDEAMLHELNEGEGDMHTLSAKMLYNIPKDMKASEVKKKFHDERQNAKTLEFAVFYGSQGMAVANKLNLSNEEATELYEKFMGGFSGLKKYQDFRRKDWLEKGYILINKKTGHKSFVSHFNSIKQESKEFSGNEFWNNYRARKANLEDPLVQRVRKYFKRRSGIERNSINYPVQGTGALCMKTAMVNYFEWLRRKGLLFEVLLCDMPYDEVCFEAPDAVADECANKMRECMVKSGAYFVTRCRLDAEISYDKDGKLPNYWIH